MAATIKKTRTYCYHPYRVFEAEIDMGDDEFVYMNIDVRNRKELTLEDILDTDCIWWHTERATEIDDCNDYYRELSYEEFITILTEMIKIWNSNPVFVDREEEWTEV